MPLLRIETRIQATQTVCFDLARSVSAHVAPMSKSGERVVAGKMTGLLGLGDEVTWEARHFGVKQRLTARITRMEAPTLFVDEMVSGAFAEFQHSHEFEDLGAGTTLMRDIFSFRSPLGPLGRLADALFLTRYMRRLLQVRASHLKSEAEAHAR
jgi:ligand-binding SRPBCC domain-containing protein